MDRIELTYLLVILGVAFLTIGILSGIVVYLLLRQNDRNEQITKNKSEIEDLNLTEDAFCYVHDKESARGTCCICEKSFCESCIKEHDGLAFCGEHLRTFSENKWVDITNIKTTPNNPEAAMFVYKFKRDQWKDKNIPTYIVTHYKINIDGDHVESYVMLYVRSQDEELLKRKINQIN